MVKYFTLFLTFSEICHRLQTARPSVIKCLLYYLLPWLYNLELVDPNVNPGFNVINFLAFVSCSRKMSVRVKHIHFILIFECNPVSHSWGSTAV